MSSPPPPPQRVLSTTLLDIPAHLLSSLAQSYLALNDLLSLRLVSWNLRSIVDSECKFIVTLNSSSVRWVKGCVPYIHQVIVGPLKIEHFHDWPDEWFPEVESIRFNPGPSEDVVQKLFTVFPNIRELNLFALTGEEIMSVLRLQLDEMSISLNRNKIRHAVNLVTPSWFLIRHLQIVLNQVHECHGEVFRLLSRRTYPCLNSIHLEYNLKGHFTSGYHQLHPIYVSWMEFISNHYSTLEKLILRHDLGIDIDPQYVPENPHEFSGIPPNSMKNLRLANIIELIDLKEFNLKPHFHESFMNPAWNWNVNLLKWQKTLTHFTIDCSDSNNLRNPQCLQQIIISCQTTLESFVYTAASDKGPEDNPLTSGQITFDCSMFQNCQNLTRLNISRGWSCRTNAWGPSLIFQNVKELPKSIKVLKFLTENNKFKITFALWIAKNLTSLEELQLPICMTKSLVTNFLSLPNLRRFTLVRDYFSEIKLNKMVNFCEQTPGIQYHCPDIAYYDSRGRWLDLLIIQVMVDRKVFKLSPELIKKHPDILKLSSAQFND